MNKELKPLEAAKWLIENKRKHWLNDDISNECLFTIAKSLKALEIIKNCIVGEFELKDNCDTNNAFKSSYRFRIYANCYEFNEWILKNKEEYDLLKEVLL